MNTRYWLRLPALIVELLVPFGAALLALVLAGCTSEPVESVGRDRARLDSVTYALSGIIYGGGTPLSGAAVDALEDGTTTIVAGTSTDPGGHYSLALPSGTYDLRVAPPAGTGFAPEIAQNILIGSADLTHDVILLNREGAELLGRVSGYGGVPVEGAQLYVYSQSTGQFIGNVATDAGGNYSVNLAEGGYSVRLIPPSTAVTPSWSDFGTYNVEVSGTTTLNLPLPVAAISGIVTDSNGVPVPGTSLSVSSSGSDGPNRYWSSSSSAVTADDGHYRVLVLAGSASFEIRPPVASGLGPMFVSGVAVVEDGPFDFRLGSLSSNLVGQVSGYGGVPVEGAQIYVYSQSTGQFIGNVATDAGGNYSVNLAEGGYSVRLIPPSTAVTPSWSDFGTYNVEVSGTTTLNLPLPVVAISGIVTDSNGVPVPGTSLSVSSSGSDGPNRYWSSSSSAVTADDGHYRVLVLAGSASFEIRPPVASGLGPMFVSGVAVVEDGPFDFRLGSLSSNLVGQVSGYGGVPVEGAQIYVYSQSTGQFIGNVATDAGGNYSVNLAEGGYSVRLIPPNTAVTPSWSDLGTYNVEVSGTTTLNLPLPVVAISGIVTDSNGVPVPGTSLSVSSSGSDGPNRYWSSSSSAVTADDGRYRLLVLLGSASFEIRPPAASGFAPAFLSAVPLSADLGQSVILALVDRTPPVIVAGPTVIHLSDTSVSIRWTTNEAATSRVTYGVDGLTQLKEQSELTLSHSVTLVGLTPSSVYSYEVSSTDAQGNGPVRSAVFAFRTQDPPGDVTAPIIVSGPVVTFTSDTSAIVTWETDEPASSRLDYGTTSSLGSTASNPSGRFLQVHSVTLTGLALDTEYFARASSSDPDGNGPTTSDLVTFRTSAAPDPTAPVITSGPSVIAVTDHSMTVVWTTDEPATSGVSFHDETHFDVVSDAALVTEHAVTLAGLSASTSYEITVSSIDAVGNGPTLGGPITSATSALADVVPPVLSGLAISDVTESTAVVSWLTNEASTTKLSFGLDPNAPDGVVSDLALVLEHHVLLTGLKSGQTYYVRAESTDGSGNAASSPLLSFVTSTSGPATDSDHDGVPDAEDTCPGTPRLQRVDAKGCSIADLCPCKPRGGKPPWKNHGAYVTCVEAAVRRFVRGGIIDDKRGKSIAAAARCSTCGSHR